MGEMFKMAGEKSDSLTILSLFDYSGVWSNPFKDDGYNVIKIDIQNGVDVFTLHTDSLPRIHGILAALPCTDFANSGNAWKSAKLKNGDMFESIALAYKTLSIIWKLRSRDDIKFWCIENPVGQLNEYVPQLKKYGPYYFQPCDYGDPYTKKTGLWGEFIFPDPLFIGNNWSVKPTEGSKIVKRYGGKSLKTKNERSITPSGFAKAFFVANRILAQET